MAIGYDILTIPVALDEGLYLVLTSPSGVDVDLDPKLCTETGSPLPPGWKGRAIDSTERHVSIQLKEQGARTVIRLLETKTYEWELQGEGLTGIDVITPLTDKRKQRWLIRRSNGVVTGGQFTVINHLGYSSLKFQRSSDHVLLVLPLEFVSRKLDFDSEYRKMTEDIANFCEQLLLVWSAPTSLRFVAGPTKQSKLLLERFLFLRNFLSDERLGRLLEVIERNPHSQLRAQKEWKPATMTRSTNFLSHPGSMLRSWSRRDGKYIPGEVLDIRKEDTHDTAPNRFVKFALAQFRQLCNEVVESLSEESSVGSEACELMQHIDSIMGKRFFRDIHRLNRLPLDNQTLQKGEGYREILRAWLLTEAAASLNWKGQEESYEGSTRDVATLYEYWIFIQLHRLLENVDGMKLLDGDSISGDDVDSFVKESAGQITINLRSGKQSRAGFLLSRPAREDLRIDLHYERTFNLNKLASWGGSYSRNFRPDYTLTLFPAQYDSEELAEAEGKVAHLHFDAKYRAVKLDQVFGSDDEVSVTQEKQDAKTISTYQRGDLLKMHTYNDALRQTIGSYVLYPGDSESKTELRKFHEIAPGVGALVMKPGQKQCLETLAAFLEDVFAHQANQFTQHQYLADTRYKMIQDQPETLAEDGAGYYVARKDAPCVLLWLKKAMADVFREHGFAYCHAVPKDDPEQSKKLDLDLSIEVGSEFLPCGGGQGRPLQGLGWRAKITSARFMSKEKLLVYLEGQGLAKTLNPKSVDHYLLFEFDENADIAPLALGSVHRKYRSGSKYMAVSCTWKEILAVQSVSG